MDSHNVRSSRGITHRVGCNGAAITRATCRTGTSQSGNSRPGRDGYGSFGKITSRCRSMIRRLTYSIDEWEA
jgi:hypothetical protein